MVSGERVDGGGGGYWRADAMVERFVRGVCKTWYRNTRRDNNVNRLTREGISIKSEESAGRDQREKKTIGSKRGIEEQDGVEWRG